MSNFFENNNDIKNDQIIFEIDHEDVFDTALATCQHSIIP